MFKINLMRRLGQKGELNILLIPLILVSILFVVAVIFAFSVYQKEQDYKNNSDQKVAAAVKESNAKQQQIDAKHYAEVAKKPLSTYTGPEDFGSVKIKYPKTWSLYVETGNNSTPVDGYGYPKVVPGEDNDNKTAYALRFQVLSDSYDEIVSQFDSQVKEGKVKVRPYKPKNVKGVIGVVVTGQIENELKGKMVILPLRNMTLEVYTESSNFLKDFDKYILPNFSFSP